MSGPLTGVILSFRTRNARKTRKISALCADYGLVLLHKGLYAGSLQQNECQKLSALVKAVLRNKHDHFFSTQICMSCLKGFDGRASIAPQAYELV